MPEDCIVSDEAITSGWAAKAAMNGARPHEWLYIMGGAIGQGMPVSIGAAVACPDRKVFSMESDGSAMYTVQSLWTQAREKLDIVTVMFSNRAYRILEASLDDMAVDTPGPKAREILSLENPVIDWVKMADSMGVHATRAETADDFSQQLSVAVAEPGPHFIEVKKRSNGPLFCECFVGLRR